MYSIKDFCKEENSIFIVYWGKRIKSLKENWSVERKDCDNIVEKGLGKEIV